MAFALGHRNGTNELVMIAGTLAVPWLQRVADVPVTGGFLFPLFSFGLRF